jgi:excisionase family DNA binding protein
MPGEMFVSPASAMDAGSVGVSGRLKRPERGESGSMDAQRLMTTRQVAEALGVSEASVKRWCDQGRFDAVRTAGGHRRVRSEAVFQFLRDTGFEVLRPELLGLPGSTRRESRPSTSLAVGLASALSDGDAETSRRILLGLVLSGRPLAEVFDQALAPALHELGSRWSDRHIEVYQERRACMSCLDILVELRALLPAPKPGAPRALGGTLSGDHYIIPSSLVALVMRDLGYDARSIGTHLPASTIAAAVERERPSILWLSVSHIEDLDAFRGELPRIVDATDRVGASLVLGGRALTDDVRRGLRYATFCDRLQNLVDFVRALGSVASTGPVGTIDGDGDGDGAGAVDGERAR